MISLGRGFFDFHFRKLKEKDRIWTMGSWTIKLGVLRLQQWSANFNLHNQRPTDAQIWMRPHELSWEYLDTAIVSNIVRVIEVPLKSF